jgi:hypothetical protein
LRFETCRYGSLPAGGGGHPSCRRLGLVGERWSRPAT